MYSYTVDRYIYFSLAIHPDKVRVATGQVAGHERKDTKVSLKMQVIYCSFYDSNIFQKLIKIFSLLIIFSIKLLL